MAADTLHTPRLHTGPAPGTPGISLHGLTLAYGRRVLLRDADAVLPQGSITALIGRNGTGKSTLLRAIAGLGTATGEIRLCGKPLAALTALQRASTVSFVTTDKIRIANLACEDVVALGRAPYTNWIGRMQQADRDIVSRSLSLVGMSSFARKTMDRMSDGECQRILIARALAQDTPVILLDEPTAFLDLPNRYELASLLRRLAHEEGNASSSRRTTSTWRSGSATPQRSSTPPHCTACRRPTWRRAAISNGFSPAQASRSTLRR